MKNLFIGIDFSKLKVDVSFFERENLEVFKHAQFVNEQQGFKEMIAWLKKESLIAPSEWLFCGEYTGLYSVNLSEFLSSKGFSVWIDSPLQIKLSMGIQRGKSDKADSGQLALYAYRFEDKAKAYAPLSKQCKSLQMLYAHRERLVKVKVSLSQAATELRMVIKRDPTVRYIYDKELLQVNRLKKDIKDVEKKMLECIEQDPQLYKNYTLLVSIKGIALINAVSMIIHTGNFTRFVNARQYACYVGVAPFGKTSGTSKKNKPRISKIANKECKALLTQAAKCSCKHNPELREYYNRKIAEGKPLWLVTNNIRNKLIARCFSVIARQEPYQESFRAAS